MLPAAAAAANVPRRDTEADLSKIQPYPNPIPNPIPIPNPNPNPNQADLDAPPPSPYNDTARELAITAEVRPQHSP